MLNRRLRTALVGCGEQGQGVILPSLQSLSEVSIEAVCDSDAAKARATAAAWRVAHCFDDPHSLIDSGIVDAVVLAATPQAHAAIAAHALAKRLPVFVEKPPATSIEELRKLVALERECGTTVQIGHNFRYSLAVRRLRSILQSRDFGSPLLVNARYFASWPRIDRWGLGSPVRAFLLTHLIHVVDLVLWMFGRCTEVRPAARFDAVTGKLVVSVGLTCEWGSMVQIEATNCAPRFEFELTCVGSNDAVVSMNGFRRIRVAGADKNWKKTWEPGQFEHSLGLLGYAEELRAFFQSAKNGSAGDPSLAAALEVYQVLTAIERAAGDKRAGETC